QHPTVASYSCSAGTLPIASCTAVVTPGGRVVANGGQLDTYTAGRKTLTVTATDTAGNTSSSSVHYVVRFQVCGVFDTKATYRIGAPDIVPVKLQLCDASNVNLSAATMIVTTTRI